MKAIVGLFIFILPLLINSQNVNIGYIVASPVIGTNDINLQINSYCGNVHFLNNYNYTNNNSNFNIDVCYEGTLLLMPTNITSDITLSNANTTGYHEIIVNAYFRIGIIDPVNTCSNVINSYILTFDGPLTQQRFFTLDNNTFGTKKISLYPNPNNGTFSLDLPASTIDIKLEIIDLSGKVIYNNNNYTGSPIEIKYLAKGVYFAKLTQDQTNETLKFIVN